MKSFETRVPAKWVLTGEHTVLRGGSAVALPHPEFELSLRYMPGEGALEVRPEEAREPIREILAAISARAPRFATPSGTLEIGGNIPLGSGMGSSAALCVAMTRWLAPELGLAADEYFSFATELEHRFHGKSSGMDIAATLAARPIVFSMKDGASALELSSLPKFTFHDTELRARTSDCVKKVQDLRQTNPKLAAELDEKMAQATGWAVEGLRDFSRGRGAEKVAAAMNQAQDCFSGWGLVPDSVEALIMSLKTEGALAAKLTGAGAGGFVVALWVSKSN